MPQREGRTCANITGMGIVSALGMDMESHRRALMSPEINCDKVPEWLFYTSLDYPVFHAGRRLFDDLVLTTKPAFDLCCFYGVNRTMELLLFATIHALVDAGFDLYGMRGASLGIVIGTTVGCTFNNENYYSAWRRGEELLPCAVLAYTSSNIAGSLHDYLGTSGPSAVVTNACASGTDSIGIALDWIRYGICDVVIAGGADELSRIAYNGFASLMLTSDSPCRPFDCNRAGLNLGEGAGIVVMESDAHVAASGREGMVKGIVTGYGTSSDSWHPTAPHPEGKGLVNAFEMALEDAGVDSSDISLINAHGTGTVANDSAESAALSATFGKSTVPVISTKGMTGHTLGAAGAIETVLTLLALQEGAVAGTVGCSEPDPSLRFMPVPQGERVKVGGRIAVSQSLAFGGSNSVLVLECSE